MTPVFQARQETPPCRIVAEPAEVGARLFSGPEAQEENGVRPRAEAEAEVELVSRVPHFRW